MGIKFKIILTIFIVILAVNPIKSVLAEEYEDFNKKQQDRLQSQLNELNVKLNEIYEDQKRISTELDSSKEYLNSIEKKLINLNTTYKILQNNLQNHKRNSKDTENQLEKLEKLLNNINEEDSKVAKLHDQASILEEAYNQNDLGELYESEPPKVGEGKTQRLLIAKYWQEIIIFAILIVVCFLLYYLFRKRDNEDNTKPYNRLNVRHIIRNGSFLQNGSLHKTNLKPINEKYLIEWWDENGDKTFEECETTLKKLFGKELEVENDDNFKHEQNDQADWYVIGVKRNRSSNDYYILPRKGAEYKYMSKYLEEWKLFSKQSDVQNTYIDSLLQPTKAVSTGSNDCKILQPGMVGLAKNKFISLNEKDLTEWCRKNVSKTFKVCEENLKEKFGPNIIVGSIIKDEFISGISETNRNVEIIGVKESRKSKDFYVLPCINKYNEIIANWFDVEGENIKDNGNIVLCKTIVAKKGAIKVRGKVVLEIEKHHHEKDYKDEAFPPNNDPISEDKLPNKVTIYKLKEWWNKNGSKAFPECEASLLEGFGTDIKVEIVEGHQNIRDEWYLIRIKENKESKDYYNVLPRKGTDNIALTRQWFDTQIDSRKAFVDTLIDPAKESVNNLKTPSKKGKVLLKEFKV